MPIPISVQNQVKALSSGLANGVPFEAMGSDLDILRSAARNEPSSVEEYVQGLCRLIENGAIGSAYLTGAFSFLSELLQVAPELGVVMDNSAMLATLRFHAQEETGSMYTVAVALLKQLGHAEGEDLPVGNSGASFEMPRRNPTRRPTDDPSGIPFPAFQELGGAQGARDGVAGDAAEANERIRPENPLGHIVRNAQIRTQVLEDVGRAIEALQDIEADQTERLIADYAIVDLRRVESLLLLEPAAVSEALAAEEELKSAKSRLERVRDFFGRLREPVAQRLVAEALIRVIEALSHL